MLIRKQLIHRVYLFFAMLCATLCGLVSMLENDGENTIPHSALLFAFTFILLFPPIIAYLNNRIIHRPPTFIKWVTILFLGMLISGTVFGLSNLRDTILFNISLLTSMELLFALYTYSNKYGEDKYLYWAFVCIQLIFLIQYIHIYSAANLLREAHLITSYYPLFLLPLVLLIPFKLVKVASIIIVSLAIFASFKRGGLIALILGLLVYIVCNRHIQSKGIKSILYAILVIGILGIFFYYLAMSEYGVVIERIMAIGDDGGSGRTEVWDTTWNMILDSDFPHFIIGHGHKAVWLDSPLGLSAHNDFLESWYDYGIIGFFLYLASIISLTRYSKRLLIKKSHIAASFAMMLTIMLILTTISIVLISYFITLCCMNFGFMAGLYEHNEHHE